VACFDPNREAREKDVMRDFIICASNDLSLASLRDRTEDACVDTKNLGVDSDTSVYGPVDVFCYKTGVTL
jgi:hypothetical protein